VETCTRDNPRGVLHRVDEEPGNQQERLITVGWVVGFVDGEGCFSIGFVRQPDRVSRKGYKTGYQVTHDFVVPQGSRSVTALEGLREFFGVGNLYLNKRHDNHREHLYSYSVQRRKDLRDVIVPFFQRYPLRTAKRDDFEKFARVLELVLEGGHLTTTGLIEIAEIAQTMNRRIPRDELIRILRGHTPDVRQERMKIWSDLHGDVQG
jgi:hypothetical protein